MSMMRVIIGKVNLASVLLNFFKKLRCNSDHDGLTVYSNVILV